jgi:hypothetical protein
MSYPTTVSCVDHDGIIHLMRMSFWAHEPPGNLACARAFGMLTPFPGNTARTPIQVPPTCLFCLCSPVD